jgi:SagB-type dehydrogenase family enzyme
MKTRYGHTGLGITGRAVILAVAGAIAVAAASAAIDTDGRTPTQLPPPPLVGKMSLEEAIRLRRSVREFTDKPLTIEQIGRLCWAAQGITDPQRGFRAAPSAGALYPMELYVVTPDGVEHYLPKRHVLERHLPGDFRKTLHQDGGVQDAVEKAPATLVIAAEVSRSAKKYRDRAERYCFMEAGHIAQNLLLEATALHLAGLPIGGLDDERAAAALKLPKGYRVLYVLPIGHPRG